MSQPGPKAHLVRLAAVVLGALFVFLIVKEVVTPASWNYKDWYRGDALALNESYQVVYGGNDSCNTCHQEINQELAEFKHQALSCESCHGALADHVQEGEKIADAQVDDQSSWQCLNCHDARISKPANFPQFDNKKIDEHREIEPDMFCITCHTPHDPVP
jgi:hypothetical protein